MTAMTMARMTGRIRLNLLAVFRREREREREIEKRKKEKEKDRGER